MIYTGIGSRSCPPFILQYIKEVAEVLAKKGWILRSGGAEGCDSQFEYGAKLGGGKFEIFRPKDANKQSDEILRTVVEELNKTEGTTLDIDRMKTYTRQLLSRNMFQVLGRDLNTPSDCVICYTKGGELVGGTRYAIQLAIMRNIPVLNIGSYDFTLLEEWRPPEEIKAWIEYERTKETPVIDWNDFKAWANNANPTDILKE